MKDSPYTYSLPKAIAEIGDQQFADQFGVSRSTAVSWRCRLRYPRPKKALEIIAGSEGRISWHGIYGTHTPVLRGAPRAKGPAV
jgi:hypothetical protein